MHAQINSAFVHDDEDSKIAIKCSSSSTTIPLPSSTQISPVIDYAKAAKRPQIYAALSAALGAYMMGTTYGWSSSVQNDLTRNATMEEDTESIWYLQLTNDEFSWASSLVNIGGLFGSLSGGFLMERFGRRTILGCMSLPYIIGWLLITFAIDPSMFYIGRIITGWAAGVCSAAAPCYVGEISTPKMRGIVGTFFSFGISFGIFVTSLLVYLDWRWVSGISLLQSIFLAVAMYFVPETPYYLVKTCRVNKAEKALNWLRGPEYQVQSELDQISDRIQVDSNREVSLTDLSNPGFFKPVLIGMSMIIIWQYSGINVALFFSVEIFRLAGSSLDPTISSILIKAVQVVMNFIAMLLVQHLRRRTLFLSSAAFTSLSVFMLGGYFYILKNDPATAATLGWLPLVSLIAFIASVAVGISPLAWVVSNEILPARFRGPGSSFAAFTAWMSSFIVTKTFVNVQSSLTTAGAFWIYGCFGAIGILFGIFVLPETKGKTPDEIQAIFRSEKDFKKPYQVDQIARSKGVGLNSANVLSEKVVRPFQPMKH